jgi:hypothetical protein
MGKKWEKDPEARFFTFPVELLRGAFTDIKCVCYDALAYTVYLRHKDYEETADRAFKYLGWGKVTDSRLYFNRGKVLYDSFDRPPLVSVKKEVIIDFWLNPKTDFEIAVFCAFCGLRSIIGAKPFVKTNNGLLMARMFGFRSLGDFEALREKPPYYVAYFSTAQKVRYQLTEKIIKNELSLNWGLKCYSNQSKGFYASFKMEFDALVLHAEKSRKATLLRQQQEEQKRVIEQIKKQVRGK